MDRKELFEQIQAKKSMLCVGLDVDFDKINWGLRKKFVISRILERGSEEEKAEIARFYNLSIDELELYRNNNTYKVKI